MKILLYYRKNIVSNIIS